MHFIFIFYSAQRTPLRQVTVILSGKPSKCTFEGSDIRIFRIAIGNITKNESVEQMEHIKIFLHEKGKFIYFLEQDNMPDSFKIEPLTLKREHATTFKLR